MTHRRSGPLLLVLALSLTPLAAQAPQDDPLTAAGTRVRAIDAELSRPTDTARLASLEAELGRLVTALHDERSRLRAYPLNGAGAAAVQARLAYTDGLLQSAADLQSAVAEQRQADALAETLRQLTDQATDPHLDSATLQTLLRRAGEARRQADARLADLTAQQEVVRKQLDLLGPAGAGEPEAVTASRWQRSQQQARLARLVSLYRLDQVQADELIRQQTAKLQEAATARLLGRQTDLAAAIGELLVPDPAWTGFAHRAATIGTGFTVLRPWELGLGALLLLLAAGLGLWLRGRLCALAERPRKGFAGALWTGLLSSLARHSLALAVLGALSALMAQVSDRLGHASPLAQATYALTLFVLVRTLYRVVLAPFAPAQPMTVLGPGAEAQLARRIGVLLIVFVFGYVLTSTARTLQIPEPGFIVARALVVGLLCANLAWLLWLISRLPTIGGVWRRLSALAFVVLAVVLGAELAGYRALSAYLLRGVIGTLALSPLLWLLRRLGAELVQGLHQGGPGWLGAPRRWLGLSSRRELPGQAWLRFLVALVVWVLAVGLLLRVWTSASAFATAVSSLERGVTLAGASLQPLRIGAALFALGLLMLATEWLAAAFEDGLTRHGELDTGARAATVTVARYAGIAIALLVVVSLLGLDLTKVTVVAGALSVGVGLGLQTIVNNFVSGLILLFERPVQVGDKVKVGEFEGTIRRLSVRATMIVTSTGEEVIIPNQTLVSGPVVNRTRRTVLEVKLTVPADADPEQVTALLKQAAAGVEGVRQDAGHEVEVLCTGIVENGLEVEVDVTLENPRQKDAVLSRLHQAMLLALQAAGLRLPAPRHEVWVHTEGDGGGGTGEGEEPAAADRD